VETPAFFALAPVDSLSPEVDPRGELEIHYKPEETPITLAAKKSYLGRVYLDWAQYPVTETQTLPGGGYIVTFQDLRYVRLASALRGRTRRPLSAGVKLDGALRVLGDVYDRGDTQVVVPEPGPD
jgi:inner membrane protein